MAYCPCDVCSSGCHWFSLCKYLNPFIAPFLALFRGCGCILCWRWSSPAPALCGCVRPFWPGAGLEAFDLGLKGCDLVLSLALPQFVTLLEDVSPGCALVGDKVVLELVLALVVKRTQYDLEEVSGSFLSTLSSLGRNVTLLVRLDGRFKAVNQPFLAYGVAILHLLKDVAIDACELLVGLCALPVTRRLFILALVVLLQLRLTPPVTALEDRLEPFVLQFVVWVRRRLDRLGCGLRLLSRGLNGLCRGSLHYLSRRRYFYLSRDFRCHVSSLYPEL